jgi:hypothetical protein
MLAGCEVNPLGPHDVTTATDRQRLAIMRADPIFKTTVPGTADYTVGQLWGVDSWRRGEVLAEIYRLTSPADTMSPLPVQAFVRDLITGMQSRGWVIYYARCNFDSLEPGVQPGVLAGAIWWYNTVYAYRIYQGTSYWVQITTNANASDGPDFESDVQADMIVPAASERANLFSDHPAGIPAGSVCAAQPGQLSAAVTQGRLIVVGPESDRIDPAHPGPADTYR